MPRDARTRSISGIYHVIWRSVNQQQIFYDRSDYERFLGTLSYYKKVSGFELYCYCLMGNHVHLLIKDAGEPLQIIFRRVGASFVYWYNKKYERTGHLFQDRFKSETINDKRYFFTVLRYIIQNPVKAGICACPQDYEYSSMREYIAGASALTDTSYALEMAGHDELVDYFLQKNNDNCLESEDTLAGKVSDRQAIETVTQVFGNIQVNTGSMRRSELEDLIRQVICTGISIRQLSRLTGISKSIIERSVKRGGILKIFS